MGSDFYQSSPKTTATKEVLEYYQKKLGRKKERGMDVKRIRQIALMTQHEFAKELGIAVGTVAKWEIELTQPNMTSKRKIVEFCKKHGIEVRY